MAYLSAATLSESGMTVCCDWMPSRHCPFASTCMLTKLSYPFGISTPQAWMGLSAHSPVRPSCPHLVMGSLMPRLCVAE